MIGKQNSSWRHSSCPPACSLQPFSLIPTYPIPTPSFSPTCCSSLQSGRGCCLTWVPCGPVFLPRCTYTWQQYFCVLGAVLGFVIIGFGIACLVFSQTYKAKVGNAYFLPLHAPTFSRHARERCARRTECGLCTRDEMTRWTKKLSCGHSRMGECTQSCLNMYRTSCLLINVKARYDYEKKPSSRCAHKDRAGSTGTCHCSG